MPVAFPLWEKDGKTALASIPNGQENNCFHSTPSNKHLWYQLATAMYGNVGPTPR